MDKPILIIIEGQDRTGKDTLIDTLGKEGVATVYKQKTSEEQGVDYTEANGYQNWLVKYIGHQLDELEELSKTNSVIAMTRLLTSDNVFSDMFKREHVVEKTYKERLYKNFNVFEYCMLWDSYAAYTKRLGDIKEPIQYDFDQFMKIKTLFLQHSSETTPVMIVNGDTKPENVYKDFMEQYGRRMLEE